jgi:methanogenic corrinoid protein MtbC1
MNNILDNIANSISELKNTDNITELINQAISEGILPVNIIEEGIRKGLESVGEKYEQGTYFLSELLFAAEIVSEALNVLKPYLRQESIKSKGKIVLGTVRGDLHDIGKNIFKMLALASGFEVTDLGVDVEPELFVEEVRKKSPEILAMSALLTTTIKEMDVVIDSLKKAGLRDKVKVLLGGNAVSKEFGHSIGADAVALNAIEGVEICKKWVEKDE